MLSILVITLTELHLNAPDLERIVFQIMKYWYVYICFGAKKHIVILCYVFICYLQSNEPPETISVASFAQKFRPRHVQYVPSPPYAMKLMSPRLNSDPLISNASVSLPKKSHIGGTMNGYPLKLLEFMVKVNKILAAKKVKIKKLKEMNSEAEKRRSFGELLPPDFERKYAG